MELRVAVAPASVGRCRHWAAYMGTTYGAGPGTVRMIELLTSELATGVLRDAAGGHIVVTFARLVGELEIALSYDAAPVTGPLSPETVVSHTILTGSGCPWGTRVDDDGRTTVWFRIAAGERGEQGPPSGGPVGSSPADDAAPAPVDRRRGFSLRRRAADG